MNKQFSIYLDLLRFVAAGFVFLSHVTMFAGGWLWQLAAFGHEAVVFFFVLSGFVIAYVVYEREEKAFKYTVNRLSRIYSVTIPALLLTIILYYGGHAISPEAFQDLDKRLLDPVWTLFSGLFFINQSWVGTPMLSNLPYWSLGYEVLYYCFFGVFVFTKGWLRLLLLLGVVGVMGPSILLYLPIWLTGVWCFRNLNRFQLSLRRSVLLYVVSIFGIFVFVREDVQNIVNLYAKDLLGESVYGWLLEPADKFAADYLLAVFVTLHLYAGYHVISQKYHFSEWWEKVIRYFSAHTFSLYLYHMPMLYFVSAVVPYDSNPILNIVSCWLLIPLSILLLSTYTENKKASYQTFFSRGLGRLRKAEKYPAA
ncbi:MAG: acyltransferase [Cellvibrionaceae bacterium]